MAVKIPIILVHTGDSFYLEPALRQARKSNPESHIYLISDESTNHYDFIEHVNISDYMASAEQFEKVYVHLSINPYHYELFCLQRWFIILEFVKKNNILHFLCIDSDVMLYCSVDEVFGKWIDYDMATCQIIGPQYTLFSQDSLKRFCEYIYAHYADKQGLEEVKSWHTKGAISDMNFFRDYSEKPNIRIFNTAQVVDGACFDYNMKISQKKKKKGRLKKIYWKEGVPYCKSVESGELIRMNGLHFQGGVKHHLYKYIYRANQSSLGEILWGGVKWYLNPKRIRSRLSELKKIVSNKEMFIYFIKVRVFWRFHKKFKN